VQYGRRIDNGLSVSKRDHDSIVQSIDTDDAGLDTHHDIFIRNFANCLSAGKQSIGRVSRFFSQPGIELFSLADLSGGQKLTLSHLGERPSGRERQADNFAHLPAA
jgi:hypothetical protein